MSLVRSRRFGALVRLMTPFVVIPVALVACASKHDAATPGAGTTPIAASQELDALKMAGLDPANLPPLHMIGKENRRPVMHTFADSLGVECGECHVAKPLPAGAAGMGMAMGTPPAPAGAMPPMGAAAITPDAGAAEGGADAGPALPKLPFDFDAWTPKKRIAAKMWSEFVQKLEFKDGTPVYCDSCHQKKAEFLDRSDDDALGQWMHDNFVAKLQTKTGQALQCTTCHGSPFDGEFVKKWSEEPAVDEKPKMPAQ